MKIRKGDMWSAFANSDLFLITTNAKVRNDGALVMGRGMAKEAILRFPQLQFDAGNYLIDNNLVSKKYGIIRLGKIGLFQVKYHWNTEADLDLIDYSCKELIKLITSAGLTNINLNFPGIGNGGLDIMSVLPVIQQLPDVVTIWEK